MITRYKLSGEARKYAFNFSQVEEILGGDTLFSDPVITATLEEGEEESNPLVIASPFINEHLVEAIFMGGVSDAKYSLLCLVTTVAGSRIGGRATLVIV
jgi:hypothetical protein